MLMAMTLPPHCSFELERGLNAVGIERIDNTLHTVTHQVSCARVEFYVISVRYLFYKHQYIHKVTSLELIF